VPRPPWATILQPKKSHAVGKVCEERDLLGTPDADGNAPVAKTYVYGNYIDEVIQIRDHTPPAPEDSYAHQDDLFSVYAITDDSGAVTQRYLYGDYGTRITSDAAGTAGFEPALEVDHGFTGRLHDETSGLIEYRHRWMRPELGRFVQRDPLWYVDGMNLYRYGRSNPASVVDPMGLCGFTIKCTQIRVPAPGSPKIPGSHCWIDFGDGTIGSGHPLRPTREPWRHPLDWGPIITEPGTPWEDSIDRDIRFPPGVDNPHKDDLERTRTTLINCPADSCDKIKRCSIEALRKIDSCTIPYDPFGPNSNGVVYAVFEKCFKQNGCSMLSRGIPKRPRTRPGAPPVGWPPVDDNRINPIFDCLDGNNPNSPGKCSL